MDDEEIDRSLRIEYGDGEQIMRNVAKSQDNEDRCWNAVLHCASNASIHVPGEYDNTMGLEASWECFCDYWDCRSRAELGIIASACVGEWSGAYDAALSDWSSDGSGGFSVQTPSTTDGAIGLWRRVR